MTKNLYGFLKLETVRKEGVNFKVKLYSMLFIYWCLHICHFSVFFPKGMAFHIGSYACAKK